MVRRLYGDSLASEQPKKETNNDHPEERQGRAELELRLCDRRRLPLQPVHVQELQLLTPGLRAPPAVAGGASRSRRVRENSRSSARNRGDGERRPGRGSDDAGDGHACAFQAKAQNCAEEAAAKKSDGATA